MGCLNGQINEKALNECVRFAIKEMNMNSSAVKQEFELDITSAQTNSEKQDSKKYEKQIQSLLLKKERVIDLLLDEVISKEEMNAMKIKYDTEICELKSKIESIKNENDILDESRDNIFDILNKIDKILRGEEISELMYKDIIEKITMYPTNDLDIYFKYLPEPLRIHYKCSGRGEKYKTLCSIRNITHTICSGINV